MIQFDSKTWTGRYAGQLLQFGSLKFRIYWWKDCSLTTVALQIVWKKKGVYLGWGNVVLEHKVGWPYRRVVIG